MAGVNNCRKLLLAAQNKEFASEIEKLKTKLSMTQILNAVTQILVPTASLGASAPAIENTPVSTSATTNGSKQEAVVSAAAAEGEKVQKEKKAPKPKAPKVQESGAASSEPEKIDISRLDLRIGLIRAAQKHPDADNLYVEEVDLGEPKARTVVSGLAKYVPLDQMANRLAIFMCNLKPVKLKGILSEGMVMCASKDGVTEIVDPPAGCQPGDRIQVPGFPGEPDAQLNPKKGVWEAVMPDLQLNDDGVATYKSTPWVVTGRDGVCKCPSLKGGAQIK